MERGWSARLKGAVFHFRTRKNSSQGEESFLNYRLTAKETVRALLVLLALFCLFSLVFYDTLLPVSPLYILSVPFFLKRERKKRAEERREQLKKEFLSGASLLGDYLKSGYSVENAVRESVNELTELWGPESGIVTEWRRMSRLIGLSMSAEDAFQEFGLRSGVEQIRNFSEIFATVKRSGGRLDETVSAVTSLLSEQFAAEEQIRTMIAAKRYEQKIMNVMPVGILMYIRMSSPELLNVMYTTLTGRLVMTACLGLYIAAYLWAEKIIDISV